MNFWTIASSLAPEARRGGFFSRLIGFFIRIVIYDIIITGISNVLGVSRMTALFIFLGILIALSVAGYIFKQKMSPGVDQERGNML